MIEKTNWLNFRPDKRKMHVVDSLVDPLTCRVIPAPFLQSVQRSYRRAYADVITKFSYFDSFPISVVMQAPLLRSGQYDHPIFTTTTF